MKVFKLFLILLSINLMISCTSIVKEKYGIERDRVNIIAHRGGANLAPENTLAAFQNALDLGVDMIEIDVILSKDGEVIVIHDDSIDRTTNGSGEVKNMNLQDIKKYDAGGWFADQFSGEKIPTLNEAMKIVDGKAILLIEIKDGDEKYPGLEKKVVEYIRNNDARSWVIVQSFNEKSVLRVKDMDNEIITYFLLGKNFNEFLNKEFKQFETGKVTEKKYNGLATHYSALNEANITQIKNMDYGLFVWTVNDLNEMVKFVKLGVDGIITDSPDLLGEILNK